jgi:hypothetical protein
LEFKVEQHNIIVIFLLKPFLFLEFGSSLVGECRYWMPGRVGAHLIAHTSWDTSTHLFYFIKKNKQKEYISICRQCF